MYCVYYMYIIMLYMRERRPVKIVPSSVRSRSVYTKKKKKKK